MASLWDTLIEHVRSSLPTKQGVNSAGEALFRAPFSAAGFLGDLIADPVGDIPSILRVGKDVITGDTKAVAGELKYQQAHAGRATRALKAVHDAIHQDSAPAKTTTQKYVDATLEGGPAGLAGQVAEDNLPDTWWKPAAVAAAQLAAGIAVPELGKFAKDGIMGVIKDSDLAKGKAAAAPKAVAEAPKAEAAPVAPTPEVVGPEDLGQPSIVADEQPPIEAQAAANDRLAPPSVLSDEDVGLVQAEQPPVAEQAVANEALAPAEVIPHADLAINDNAPGPALGLPDIIPAETPAVDPVVNKQEVPPNPTTGEPAEVTPANDVNRLDAAKNFVKNIMADESGSLGYRKVRGRARLEDIADEDLTPTQRIVLALREATPMEAEQESIYRKARNERFEAAKKVRDYSDLEGDDKLHAELARLEGAYDKVPSLAPIGNKISQEEKTALQKQIETFPEFDYPQSVRARVALNKILHDHGVIVPTKSEIELLSKVFPDIGDHLRKRTTANIVADALNTMRSLKTSGDLSAPLRQGLPLIGTKAYWAAFRDMFKQVTKNGFEKTMAKIATDPMFQVAQDHGLEFTNISSNLTKREEAFLSTFAEKIPVYGHVVRASEQTFTGFLNNLRFNRFKDLVNSAKDAGRPLSSKDLDDIAEVVNNGTGRGDLNALVPKSLTGDFDANKVSPLLSGTFFSPRFMSSRLQMLNPKYYYKLSPMARTEALKHLMSYAAFNLTLLTIAHEAGLKVGYNPMSYDFGQIDKGHSVFGATASVLPWVRLAAQEIMGEKVNPDGKKTSLTSHKFGQPTRLTTLADFLRNKTTPAMSELMDFLDGENRDGEPLDIHHPLNDAKRMAEDTIPMVVTDVKGVHDDLGPAAAAAAAPWSFFGGDVNTYEPRKKKGRARSSKEFRDGFGKEFGGSGFGKDF